MLVIRGTEGCERPREGSAVTIGVFDGVHLGHQLLIGEARRLAAELGARSTVVTFDKHPAQVVRPASAPKLLTDLDQRLELLAATGIECTLIIPFDDVRSKEPADEFVSDVLAGCLGSRAVIIGADFHFGHNRSGDVGLLERMGRDLGFEVDGIQLIASSMSGAQPVSSTAIRAALDEGDLLAANRMLGRPHEMRGVVEAGDQRARELGMRTANVRVPAFLQLPADGIYAGWYERADGSVHPAVISVGRRPTFYDEAAERLIEAHLLDFEGDLYGESAKVRFTDVVRLGQIAFDSMDALAEQMQRDASAARVALGR
ncbi:MAG: riboflavin kinase / adenylyltransferase [Actinomycetota bacterium]|nr:riboflavin kinase / adenylyltransferase [Actinomycetota bacterium]